MEVLRDGVLAFLSAVGLTTCVWLAAGAFLSREKRRNSGVLLVLPLTGDAPAMTQDVRELLRLRREIPESVIVLEDRGLTPESRALAEYFSQRYQRIELREAAPSGGRRDHGGTDDKGRHGPERDFPE